MDYYSVVNYPQFATIIIIIISLLATNASNTSRGREFEALNAWWHYNASNSHHCKWYGVTCNDAARVAKMTIQGEGDAENQWYRQLDELDVVGFPYLTTIHLTGCGFSLYGLIPTYPI